MRTLVHLAREEFFHLNHPPSYFGCLWRRLFESDAFASSLFNLLTKMKITLFCILGRDPIRPHLSSDDKHPLPPRRSWAWRTRTSTPPKQTIANLGTCFYIVCLCVFERNFGSGEGGYADVANSMPVPAGAHWGRFQY